MELKPKIMANFCVNCNPEGLEKWAKEQFSQVANLPKQEGPKKALVIGGSSGYGFSSRIVLSEVFGCETVNVSLEKEPKGKNLGSVGYWNNKNFNEMASVPSTKDFSLDCFSKESKEEIINYLKEEFGKIDLLVYSVAAPRRTDHDGNTYTSTLKPVGNSASGYSVNIKEKKIWLEEIEPATDQEIHDTIKVMGGEDWNLWVQFLKEADLLEEGFKTYSYSYIGSETTSHIYKYGTIGAAKADLVEKSVMNNEILKDINGQSEVVILKALITRASAVIPLMSIYIPILFDEMKKRGTHEEITTHMGRFFTQMAYGQDKIVDEIGQVRVDNLEMEPEMQTIIIDKMSKITEDNYSEFFDVNDILQGFYEIHGF